MKITMKTVDVGVECDAVEGANIVVGGVEGDPKTETNPL